MKDLLLSPKGRLNKQDFIKGVAVVAAIYAVLSIIGHFVKPLGGVLTFVSVLLFIPFIFLLIKRSHDGGKSGWLSIVWLIVWAIIVFVFYVIGAGLLQGDLLMEYFGLVMEAGADTEATQALEAEYGPKITAGLALPIVIFGFIGTMAAGYLINMMSGKDFEENQYGPVA